MRRREWALRAPRTNAPRAKAIVASLAVYLIPASANAHTALLGIGGFWSGVAHLLTSPDELVLLVGLAIWTSFQDARLDARVIGASFLTVLAGTLIGAGIFTGVQLNSAPAGAALMMVVGLAGAIRLRVGVAPVISLALAAGLVCGAASVDAVSGLSIALFSLGGSIAAASVLSYALLAARCFESEWGGVARRAGASWIAAIGLIMLAFSVSGHAGRG
jgi:hydrogenase/urease accessory protein HupE